MEKKEIYYTTTNPGKFDEVSRFIKEHEPSILLKQCMLDLPEVQTLDQRAITETKARQAWKFLQKPVLVDNSGIFLDDYYEFPGTLTKFVFKGIGYDGALKLAENKNATFRLHLAFAYGPHSIEMFQGKCQGTIIRPKEFKAPTGQPLDAIFLPNGSKKTYTQLRNTPDEEKFSYRIGALKKFLAWFKQHQNAFNQEGPIASAKSPEANV